MGPVGVEPLDDWCRSHGFDPGEVELRRLAWVDDRWPERLSIEVYGPRGLDLSGCLLLEKGTDHGLPGPGMVLADPLGRLLLAGANLTDGTPAADLVRRVGLWLVEGALLWLQAATEWSDADEAAPALLGLPGPHSWGRALAGRIPDGTTVTLATSPAAEDRIIPTLSRRMARGRLQVLRAAPYAEERAA